VASEHLIKGANAAVPWGRVTVTVSWAGRAAGVDSSALLLGGDGRVRSDDDFIFYNQPTHESGAVTHVGRPSEGATIEILTVLLSAAEITVDKIAFVASIDNGSFGDLHNLTIEIASQDAPGGSLAFSVPDATTETAMILGELYRRPGAWKFRAIGQGYSSGLAGVARDFGVTVDDDPTSSAGPRTADPVPAIVDERAHSAPGHAPEPTAATEPASEPAHADRDTSPPQFACVWRTCDRKGVPTTDTRCPTCKIPTEPLGGYVVAAATASAPRRPEPTPPTDEDADVEVVLQPFVTPNPYLKRLFSMKEYGRAPGNAIRVYNERIIDPEEHMLAAFKTRHGSWSWGYLVLTTHFVRWLPTGPRRGEDAYDYTDRIEVDTGVVRMDNGDQFQLKGLFAVRKFRALYQIVQQAAFWDHRNS
jgi:stress response protein SCP2